MASADLSSPAGSRAIIENNDDNEILDYIRNNDDIAVEISPVEGYSEIKMLSSPFGTAMMSSPVNNILTTDTGDGTAVTTTTPTTSSIHQFGGDLSSNNSSFCTSPSGSLDGSIDMPQWKRDLIQRRRTNSARTSGANQSVTTSTCPQKDMDTSTPVTPLIKPNSNKYQQSAANSAIASDSNHSSPSSSSQASQLPLGRSVVDDATTTTTTTNNSCKMPVNNFEKTTNAVIHHQQQYAGGSDQSSLLTGGHYTIISDNTKTTNNSSSSSNNLSNINPSGNTTPPQSPQTSQTINCGRGATSSSSTTINNNFCTPIPKLRSSLVLNSSAGDSPVADITGLTTIQPQSFHMMNNTKNSAATTTMTSSDTVSPSTSSNFKSGEQEQQLYEPLLPSIQLHSKHDTDKLPSASNESNTITVVGGLLTKTNNLINTTNTNNNNTNSNSAFSPNKSCGIVSTSATTNQGFIKNQTASSNATIKTNSNKFIKNNTVNNPKLKFNKKMVAAQDINESSSSIANHSTSNSITNDDNDDSSSFNDFDPSEELQYGPGIVSKLRVRYLSLALRQTAGKQRPQLDNLRRATSLNNLLDGGGSTGSTNDGSIIDGDTDNESNINCILNSGHHNHILHNNINNNNNIHHNHHHHLLNNQTNQQYQQKSLKNVTWLNQQQNLCGPTTASTNNSNILKHIIKEHDYLQQSNVDENNDEFVERNKFIRNYEKNSKKPEDFYKTGINNYNYIQQQQQRNGRQVKRGNDSLKRARSVEALLCEKSSWIHNNGGSGVMSASSGGEMLITEKPEFYRSKKTVEPKNFKNTCGSSEKGTANIINQPNTSTPILLKSPVLESVSGVLCGSGSGSGSGIAGSINVCSGNGDSGSVTIEDKIVNARQRLHTTEKHPPKRLTSFIDDTERPPPDLVKQTLKIFEASANRRGARGLSRNNNGQVAVKIANYKSIISQEKPAIVFPKPPSSPKRNINVKKPNSLDINAATGKNKTGGNYLNNKSSPINSPVSNLTKKFAGLDDAANNEMKSSPSPTNSQQLPPIFPRNHQQHKNHNDNSPNYIPPSQLRTPDLIPRKHFESVNQVQTTAATTTATTPPTQIVDSPVTHLTKKIERLRQQSSPPSSSSSSMFAAADSIVKSPNTTKTFDYLAATTESDPDNDENNSDNDYDLEYDDDDDFAFGNSKTTKLVSKTALDNISRAGTTQHFSFNNNSSKMNSVNSGGSSSGAGSSSGSGFGGGGSGSGEQQPPRQIGIIRPLVAELLPNLPVNVAGFSTDTKPQRDNLVISNLSQQNPKIKFSSCVLTATSVIGALPSNIVADKPALTTREIEKNLINEKKNELANLEGAGGGGVGSDVVGGSTTTTTSSLPMWQQQLNKKKSAAAAASGGSGSSGAGATINAEAQNNIMVFNFQDRKDVPDYIENDGLLIKRRRELPKPNESGFVVIGDLTLETSTDPDDYWTMGPPSPCNVEFENANIIIDGKSNLRYRSKDVSLRVQFDDSLTSTFEYPSESSMLDDTVPPIVETLSNTIDSIAHIDADEIIQIPQQQQPIQQPISQKSLGNMSLDYQNGPPHKMNTKSMVQGQRPVLPNKPLNFMQHQIRNSELTTIGLPILSGRAVQAIAAATPAVPLSSSSFKNTKTHHQVISNKISVLSSQLATNAGNLSTKNPIPRRRLKSSQLIFPTVPIGSAPLGSYMPLKAQIHTNFELGITRVPNSINNSLTNNSATTTTTSSLLNNDGQLSNGCLKNGNGTTATNGDKEGANDLTGDQINETDSLQYIKPATDDLTVAYSEGTNKTDLLY